jgi:hypothetical protein
MTSKIKDLNTSQTTRNNMAKLARKIRLALPSTCKIDDVCVLISADKGPHSFYGKNKEQNAYFNQMDKRKRPSIVVITKIPIRIQFDWLNYPDELTVNRVVNKMQDLCSDYTSGIYKTVAIKPFSDDVGSFEIIKGFTTEQQALELAQRMQLAIAEIL